MTFITRVDEGRDLSAEETLIKKQHLEELVAQGLTDGTYTPIEGVDGGIREWTTEEAANAWVAYLRATFSPPLVSATVTEK